MRNAIFFISSERDHHNTALRDVSTELSLAGIRDTHLLSAADDSELACAFASGDYQNLIIIFIDEKNTREAKERSEKISLIVSEIGEDGKTPCMTFETNRLSPEQLAQIRQLAAANFRERAVLFVASETYDFLAARTDISAQLKKMGGKDVCILKAIELDAATEQGLRHLNQREETTLDDFISSKNYKSRTIIFIDTPHNQEGLSRQEKISQKLVEIPKNSGITQFHLNHYLLPAEEIETICHKIMRSEVQDGNAHSEAVVIQMFDDSAEKPRKKPEEREDFTPALAHHRNQFLNERRQPSAQEPEQAEKPITVVRQTFQYL